MRVDVYTKIHKAHRKNLFALSEKIGRADFTDVNQVSYLKEEVKKIIHHLRQHAQNEKRFIHPFYAELGKQGERFDHEHDDLEHSLDLLEKNILGNQHDSNQIYTQFNQFITIYLKHMDEEESAQKEILWKNYDDNRLMDIIHNFQKSRTPQEGMEDLEFLLPCLNIQEILEILGSMKANAPEVAFQFALNIVKNNVTPTEYSKIHQNL